jgi:signal transduction histidine kinase
MKYTIAILLLLIPGCICAQLDKTTAKVDSLSKISAEAYRVKKYSDAENIAKQALIMSKTIGYRKGELIASFYETIAGQNKNPSSYDINEVFKYIDQFSKQGFKNEEAIANQFLANVYGYYGDVGEELKHFLTALKLFEESGNQLGIARVRSNLSLMYYDQSNYDAAFENARLAIALQADSADAFQLHASYNNLAIIFENTGPVDSAIFYHKTALEIARKSNIASIVGLSLSNLGNNYTKKGEYALAEKTLLEALSIRDSIGNSKDLAYTHNRLASLYIQMAKMDKAKYHANLSLQNAEKSRELKVKRMAYERLMEIAEKQGNKPDELAYIKQVTVLKDSILNESNTKEVTKRMLTYNFEKKQLLDSLKNVKEKFQTELVFSKKIETERNRKILFMVSGAFFLLLSFTIYRRYKFQSRELAQSKKIESAYSELQKTHQALKETQHQLIQSEKMASLGQLTAGIAHEIQNPLNFVNNFSEVNTELLAEIKGEMDKGNIDDAKAIADDAIENQKKISHHGKRADAIVKGMLQHSRSSSGIKESTNINALADEYLRLAYYGLRAKDKTFNATTKNDFDETIGNINIIPQDMGRVILNLITNAFYAVAEKKKEQSEVYEPTVNVSTKKVKDRIEIRVADNGKGIPQNIIDKIFQPFFTTKPTGQGTGLGLSMSYDIVKAHGGEIKVETKENEGTTFIIQLPV